MIPLITYAAPSIATVNAAVAKAPHELLASDLVDWYRVDRLVEDYVLRGQAIPDSFSNPLATVQPPVGAYRWQTVMFPSRELYLAKLEQVNVVDIVYDPGHKFDLEWDDVTPARRYAETMHELQQMGYLRPIVAYRLPSGKLVGKDATYKLQIAQAQNISQLSCWVIETSSDGYAMNRTKYVKAAQDAGHAVPPAVLAELAANTFFSAPLMCPQYTPQQLSRLYGASTGDRLDAVYRAINGDVTELSQIVSDDAAWVSRFTP